MEVKLTYHAVRRYLERIEGIDLKPVFAEMRRLGYGRKELIFYIKNEFGFTDDQLFSVMIPERVLRSARNCNGSTIVRHDGFTYVLREGSLVTIKPW